MICKRSRFISSVVSIFLYAAVTLASSVMVAGISSAKTMCPTTLSETLGTKALQWLRKGIEKGQSGVHTPEVVPEELAYTVSETLPLVRRGALLTPVRPKPQIAADAYYGSDYAESSPDVHVLPNDPRVLCLLQPGRAVFLSDEVTHHYAIVDTIDYQRKVVTLLDPWASVSFLLPGHNVIGVKAEPHQGGQGQPLLDLSFDEFLRALHGSYEVLVPTQMFDTMEKLYPEVATTEDYLVWKFSRLLASDDFVTSLSLNVLQISHNPNLAAMPRLRLLADWSNDYIIGVPSSFSVPAPGRAATEPEIPRLRAAFLGRLGDYAKVLPWPLKWLLLRRTDDSEDTELRLAIIDSFLKADPTDNDFQIARAETLLREERLAEALEQLNKASVQWTADVATAIAKNPPTAAVAFLFAKDYGLDSLAVLHWRYARIELLRLTALLRQNPGSIIDHDKAILDLHDKYVIGSLLTDFFPQLMKVAFLAQSKATEEFYLNTVSQKKFSDDVDRRVHFATALYQHFTTLQSIREISKPTLDVLRHSPLRAELCEFVSGGLFVPGMSKPLENDLTSFCGAPTHN